MDVKKLIKKRKPLEYLLWVGIIAVCIGLDQLTKWLTVRYIPLHGTIPIIEDVIHLTHTRNPGAAFGSLQDMPWVFNSVSSVAIIAMLLFLFLGHGSSRLQEVSVAMILAGGVGNMIDRISLGYVVDFIDFRLIDFAVFNGADSFVCVGAGLLILSLILEMKDEMKKEKAAAAERSARSHGEEDGE